MADYAIIIGLNTYPKIGDLQGAEADAEKFEQWIAAKGTQPWIRKVLSSDYAGINNTLNGNYLGARPAEADIIAAFEELVTISENNNRNGLGTKIGQRLFIFMSGHGICPVPYGSRAEKESALLMANASPGALTRPSAHIPGIYVANWFKENECFDEIYLFMDCCRDRTITNTVNQFLNTKGTSTIAKSFFAFSTGPFKKSRETVINGQVGGLFTDILIRGLNGEASEPDPADPNKRIVTFSSLANYLRDMKKYLPDSIKDDQDVQVPEVKPDDRYNGHVIVTTQHNEGLIPVEIPAPAAGATGDVIGVSFLSRSEKFRFPVAALPQVIDLHREQIMVISSDGSFIPFVLQV